MGGGMRSAPSSPRPLLPIHSLSRPKRARSLVLHLLGGFGAFVCLAYWLGPGAFDRWGLTEAILAAPLNSLLQPSDPPLDIPYDLADPPRTSSSQQIGEGKRPKEAYVTFLSSVEDGWYLTSTRLLIYQLLHDPLTRDTPSGPTAAQRDVVVVVTPSISPEVLSQLRNEGAVIHQSALIEDMPLPAHIANDESGNHHWKDQYTKLTIFNLTQYDRLLYLDNDVVLFEPIDGIWNDSRTLAAAPERGGSGLAALGERPSKDMKEEDLRGLPPTVKEEEKDYLNAGFMLLHPSQERFQELLATRGYRPFYMEQALLNHFYNQTGQHPWTPLDSRFVSHFPCRADLAAGYHALHAKMWKDNIDSEVVALWKTALGRMEAYWHRYRYRQSQAAGAGGVVGEGTSRNHSRHSGRA